MWKALVQRRYTETAGALGALADLRRHRAGLRRPARARRSAAASQWTNQMSAAFLSISGHGSARAAPSRRRRTGADQLFSLLVYKPWVVLNFGGTRALRPRRHRRRATPIPSRSRCGRSRPTPTATPRSPAASQTGTEITADGKVCINNANKYALALPAASAPGLDERDDEYEALNDGDADKLPDADPGRARRLPPRRRRQAGDRRDGGGRPVPAAAARDRRLRRRARRLPAARGRSRSG